MMIIALFCSSFVVTAFLITGQLKFFAHRLGQSIREEGPAHHQKKSGTPTCGGIAFIIGPFIAFFFFPQLFTSYNYYMWALVIGLGLVGMVDDYLILKRGKNQGLYGRHKMFGQLIAGCIFSWFLIYQHHNETVGVFLSMFELHHPLPYFLFTLFIIVSSANAVNLTDGLDGLAAGLVIIALMAFVHICKSLGLLDLYYFGFLFLGSLAAFLLFNKHPAKIFMGDVGSLALGGLLAGYALLSHKEIIFIIIGGVFVIETLSVMVQVFSFKVFKRRILKMSPLHHHFELIGWHEEKVVKTFYIIGIICALIGVWLY